MDVLDFEDDVEAEEELVRVRAWMACESCRAWKVKCEVVEGKIACNRWERPIGANYALVLIHHSRCLKSRVPKECVFRPVGRQQEHTEKKRCVPRHLRSPDRLYLFSQLPQEAR